jgi:PAS domain S-box-containing protein
MKRLNDIEVERKRLALILESSRLGTWDWNMQTGQAVYNERWAEIVGYHLRELEPLSYDTWLRLAHPDDLATAESLVVRHIQGLSPFYENTVRMRHKAGHWVWVRTRGRIIEWDRGSVPARMVGTHADISEQMEAAEALAKSERRLTAMFQLHEAVMLLIDASTGEIVDANKAAAAFYGHTVEQLRTINISAISESAGASLGAQIASRQKAHFSTRHVLASGEVRSVLVQASPIIEPDRTLVLAIVTDVVAHGVLPGA